MQKIKATYADTGEYYLYPISECECDEFGGRIDVSTQRAFCSRNSRTDVACFRYGATGYQEIYEYPDILCE